MNVPSLDNFLIFPPFFDHLGVFNPSSPITKGRHFVSDSGSLKQKKHMWTKIKLRLTCVYDTCSKPAAIIETWYGSKSGANGPSTYWSFCGAKPAKAAKGIRELPGCKWNGLPGVPPPVPFMFPFWAYGLYVYDSCGWNLAIWCNFKGYMQQKPETTSHYVHKKQTCLWGYERHRIILHG